MSGATMTVKPLIAREGRSTPEQLAAREWSLTATPGRRVPELQGAQILIHEIHARSHDLHRAFGNWCYEYGRVMKAKYGYEWEQGPAAESNEALLAAEAHFGTVKAELLALLAAPMPEVVT